MNEETLTALRGLALRAKKSSWWQPWQMKEQTGEDDAEFIAAMSPEIVLELLYEIERRHGIQSALTECRNREHELTVVKAQYEDLIYQVSRKFPGESRHETAKRYICNWEGRDSDSVAKQEAACTK